MSSEEYIATNPHKASAASDALVGHMLGGKYQVLALLGKGGMGSVYKVRQVFLGKDMALKLLDVARLADAVQIRRFQQEAKAANSLNHPGLVTVHDFGLLDSGQPFLVMEMIEGETLASHLKRNGAMSLQHTSSIFAQVCFALSYAHDQNVVHRDVKPGNIMLLKGIPLDTAGSVKVVDFGLAKIAGESDAAQALTRTGEILGSPIYMSPEQCSGGELDHRSDVYSLGCVLFEVLTGTPPFIGDTALSTMMQHQSNAPPTLKEASLGKDFPAGLERIVAKMLAKSPSDRYQDLGLVAHELSAACRGSDRVLEPKRPTTKKPAETISFTPIKLTLLLFCTIFSSSALTAIAMHSGLMHPSLPRQPVEQPQAAAAPPSARPVRHDEMYDDAVLYADQQLDGHTDISKLPVPKVSGKIRATSVIGKPNMEEFHFPDIAIGEITSKCQTHLAALGLVPTPFIEVERTEAKGECDFLKGTPLTFQIDLMKYPVLSKCPDIFKAIGPDQFKALYLKMTKVEPGPVEEQQAFYTKVLKIAATWTNLQAVGVQHMAVGVPEAEALNKLKNLIVFDFDCSTIDNQSLQHCDFLHNLQLLRLRVADLGEFAPHLRRQKNLTILKLIECRGILPESFVDLADCPKLTGLEIANKSYGDDVIKSIAAMPHLTTIRMAGNVTPDQIDKLLQSKKLTLLSVSPYSRRKAKTLGIGDERLKGTNSYSFDN